MLRLRVLGAALVALMALGIMASSAMAALPEALGTFPIKIEATSGGGEGELSTLGGGISIKCKANTVTGEITGAKTGKADVHFTGCTALGIFAANSLGDSSGTVLTGLLPFELCYTNEAKKELGIIIKEANAHIEVPSVGALINVTGSIIGTIGPLTKTKTLKVNFEPKSAGDQALVECFVSKVAKKASLLASKDEKHKENESAAIKQSAEIKLAAEVQLDD